MDSATLRELAKKTWEAHEGDLPAALTALERALHSDRSLRNAVVKLAAQQLLRDHLAGLRAVGVPRPAAGSPPSREACERADEKLAEMLSYSWPLRSGRLLGDARYSEIEETCSFYDKLIATHSRRVRMLRAVQARLPANDSKIVRKVLSEKQLRAISEAEQS